MTITGDVTVVVHDEDADAQELDELTRGLLEELLALELPDVVRGQEPGAVGGKSGVVSSLTTLVVSGGFSVAALRSLTLVVRDWIKRSGARKAVLVSGERRLEIEGVSKKTQEAVVEAWIQALATDDGSGAVTAPLPEPPTPAALEGSAEGA
ncbi:hypothetical protein [Streptomyces sp. NRRL S-1448]|uniref:hypothetical protein n=1 Tax=Streptomyces sp. NRRL S-1448 TaxID=1463883 RepID=UPI0004C05396|nr:hypothetical protein [Streptomyces sp. NRRL S-1448]